MGSKALGFILSSPWAIQPESLEQIIDIAQRHHDMTPEALAAKLGRPLDNARAVEMRGDVAVIPVRGPVFRYANLFTEISGATSLEVLARDFTAALEDRAVSRIVLDVDSPGGSAAGISEFAEMVRAADKPVTAYVSSIGASAAYWIAAAADEVVAADTALLGSIGVVGTWRPDVKGDVKIISSQSPLKQASPETEAGRAEIQRVVDELADLFISAIARYRGVDRETVMTNFGRGGMLVGAQAVEAGMADRLGSLESVIAGTSGETQKEGNTMSENNQAPEITREYLAEHHPDIISAIEADTSKSARAEGYAAGATAERERIQSVLNQAITGHEALVQTLAFDGKTTGPEAAVAVLAAEKESRANHRQTMDKETPAPVPGAASADEGGSGIDPSLPVEDRCKAQWEKDAAIRAEFGALETYTAFVRAEESGRVRRIGGKS